MVQVSYPTEFKVGPALFGPDIGTTISDISGGCCQEREREREREGGGGGWGCMDREWMPDRT